MKIINRLGYSNSFSFFPLKKSRSGDSTYRRLFFSTIFVSILLEIYSKDYTTDYKKINKILSIILSL